MNTAVPIMKAGVLQCRRPLWRGGEPLAEKLVCGAPVRKPGESYCAGCRSALYDTVQVRRAERRAKEGTKPRPARVPRFQAIHSSSWSAG